MLHNVLEAFVELAKQADYCFAEARVYFRDALIDFFTNKPFYSRFQDI